LQRSPDTIGTDIEAVPVTGLAANFSPMPRIAPPPFGREIVGAATAKLLAGLSESPGAAQCRILKVAFSAQPKLSVPRRVRALFLRRAHRRRRPLRQH
jgi:hypothetical protein